MVAKSDFEFVEVDQSNGEFIQCNLIHVTDNVITSKEVVEENPCYSEACYWSLTFFLCLAHTCIFKHIALLVYVFLAGTLGNTP